MSRITILLTAAALACVPSGAPTAGVPEDAASSSEALSAGSSCVQDGVAVVDDLEQPAGGLELPPAELLAGISGTFNGEVEAGRDTLDARFEVAQDLGEVRVVSMVAGDLSALCEGYYEVAFAATLGAGEGHLDEAFSGLLQASSERDTVFQARIPLAAVRGSLEPQRLAPELWDAAVLEIAGTYTEGAWVGELTWISTQGDREVLEAVGSFWFEGS